MIYYAYLEQIYCHTICDHYLSNLTLSAAVVLQGLTLQ